MTMQATDPVTITLQAQQWNVIIEVLQNTPLPYRVAAPLIAAIVEQSRQAEQRGVPAPFNRAAWNGSEQPSVVE